MFFCEFFGPSTCLNLRCLPEAFAGNFEHVLAPLLFRVAERPPVWPLLEESGTCDRTGAVLPFLFFPPVHVKKLVLTKNNSHPIGFYHIFLHFFG